MKKKSKGIDPKYIDTFRNELQQAVKHHCDCINHYIAGCDSPFTYMQIRDVQEELIEIYEILGIPQD